MRFSVEQFSPLQVWLIRRGVMIFVALIGVYLLGALTVGWWNSYDLFVGIKSPSEFDIAVIPIAISLMGWALAPAVIGGVAGFVVERGISRHRSRSLDELLGEIRNESGQGPR